MKKVIYLPILGIVAGESLMFFGHVYLGLAMHIINLQAITLFLIFSNFPADIKNVVQSLFLLLEMRVITLAMPMFFTITLLWYPLVYGVMFISIYFIVRNQQISSGEIGLDYKKLNQYMPAALLIGAGTGLLEYQILHPIPMITNLRLPNLFLVAIVMFVFVGAVEELIFRSILQTRLEKVFSQKSGILMSGILFGVMYSGYGLMTEILFASFFGILLGYIFQKTRSLPFILVIRGIANLLLFGILPIVLA